RALPEGEALRPAATFLRAPFWKVSEFRFSCRCSEYCFRAWPYLTGCKRGHPSHSLSSALRAEWHGCLFCCEYLQFWWPFERFSFRRALSPSSGFSQNLYKSNIPVL